MREGVSTLDVVAHESEFKAGLGYMRSFFAFFLPFLFFLIMDREFLCVALAVLELTS